MNRFDAGVKILILSGIVQCAKYISAAIYMSGSVSQSRELFKDALDYVGIRLDVISLAAFLAGALLLTIETVSEFKEKENKNGGKRNEKNDVK